MDGVKLRRDCYQSDSFGQIGDSNIKTATFLTAFNQTVLQLTYTILTFLPYISHIYYSLGCLAQNFYYCHHITAPIKQVHTLFKRLYCLRQYSTVGYSESEKKAH